MYRSDSLGRDLPIERVPNLSRRLSEGSACYTYGDSETPAQAKRAAISLAQEQAVRNHRVFVQSATKVKNFQLRR